MTEKLIEINKNDVKYNVKLHVLKLHCKITMPK